MTSYVLIPGAGGSSSYWSRVVPLLEHAGHPAGAVDPPGPDPQAGLPEYADLVVRAARDFDDVVLVAQSLGGFTAPMAAEAMAAEALRVQELVLVNAMIPVPGETPGSWWDATGAVEARDEAAGLGGSRALDVETYFLHDVDTTGLEEGQRPESDAAFGSPCTFTSWPQGRVRVLVGADDRFFPAEFQRRVAKDRLGIDADGMPGGHLIALAHPAAVADYLTSALPK